MATTVSIKITYDDGKSLEIFEVSAYGIDQTAKTFYFVKGGYKSYVPIEKVKFFGKLETALKL